MHQLKDKTLAPLFFCLRITTGPGDRFCFDYGDFPPCQCTPFPCFSMILLVGGVRDTPLLNIGYPRLLQKAKIPLRCPTGTWLLQRGVANATCSNQIRWQKMQCWGLVLSFFAIGYIKLELIVRRFCMFWEACELWSFLARKDEQGPGQQACLRCLGSASHCLF